MHVTLVAAVGLEPSHGQRKRNKKKEARRKKQKQARTECSRPDRIGPNAVDWTAQDRMQ